jgi:hypothetical protein
VEVEVINCLARLGVGVHHQTKAPVSDALSDSYLTCDLKQMIDYLVVCPVDIEDSRDMLSRDYKNMYRGLRIDVFEGYRDFVFVDDL